MPPKKPETGIQNYGRITSASELRSKGGSMQSFLSLLPLRENPLVHPEPSIVVMPLDSSDHSEYCLDYYLKYIHKPVNKVYACYVAEDYLKHKPKEPEESDKDAGTQRCCAFLKKSFFLDRVVVDVGPSPGVLAELDKQDRSSCHKVKYKVKELFVANHVKYEFRRLTGPDPWTAILDFRKEVGGTLIIMGSRGLGAFKRRVFGSVSDKVLHHSYVPVLVVKKPQGAMCAHRGSKDTVIH